MAVTDPILWDLVRNGRTSAKSVDSATVARAEQHRVGGLVYDQVEAGALDAPRDVRLRLTARHLSSKAAAQRTAAAVAEAQRLLDGRYGIALAKGLATSLLYYDTPWTRPSGDADLFFDPQGSAAMGEVVRAIRPDHPHVDALNLQSRLGRNFEVSLQVDRVHLDLHRDIMNLVLPTSQAELLWNEHTIELDLGDGTIVRTLDLEMSLLLAVFNAARDCFPTLRNFADIQRMLDAGPDFDVLGAFCEIEGWYPIASSALEVACRKLDRTNPMPPPRRWKRVLTAAWPDDLVLQGPATKHRSSRRQTVVTSLLNARRGELTKQLLGRLLPPRAVIESRYPKAAGPYPYALLQWRLAQRRANRAHIAAELGG